MDKSTYDSKIKNLLDDEETKLDHLQERYFFHWSPDMLRPFWGLWGPDCWPDSNLSINYCRDIHGDFKGGPLISPTWCREVADLCASTSTNDDNNHIGKPTTKMKSLRQLYIMILQTLVISNYDYIFYYISCIYIWYPVYDIDMHLNIIYIQL